jgi:hypothetical protein
MSSSMRVLPATAPAALSDRLFWPVAVLATLALGGFGYFFYVMFAPRTSSHATEQAAKPDVHETQVVQANSPSPSPQVETKASVATPQPATTPPSPAPSTTTENEKAAEPAPSDGVAAQPAVMKKPDEPETNPYSVPNNKPFLTHDMFDKKASPAAAKAAVKPKVPAKPDDKTKAPAARAAEPNSAASTAIAATGFHGKIYVLKDGRRISTVSTVDLGDSYGVKDLNSSYITIPKSDVAEVVAR